MFDLPPNIQKTELICLDATAFQALFETLVEKIKKENKIEHDPYLSTEEAAQLLKCNDETLRKYWKDGHIARAEFSKKHIVYDRESIMAFIKKRTNTPNDGNK